MNRQQWKDLIEAVGFVAVIASLVFVGVETRNSAQQSELTARALEISAYRELMANIDDLNMVLLENPATANVLSDIWSLESASPETFQAERALFILFRHGDLAYFMYERGAINEDRLRSALRPVPIYSERGREFWEAQKHNFTKGYRSYIDRLIDELEPAGSVGN